MCKSQPCCRPCRRSTDRARRPLRPSDARSHLPIDHGIPPHCRDPIQKDAITQLGRPCSADAPPPSESGRGAEDCLYKQESEDLSLKSASDQRGSITMDKKSDHTCCPSCQKEEIRVNSDDKAVELYEMYKAVSYIRRMAPSENIRAQKGNIAAFSDLNGLAIVKEINETSRSSGTFSRDGISELLSFLEDNGTIGFVVVNSLRTISSSTEGLLAFLSNLHALGVALCTVDKGLAIGYSAMKILPDGLANSSPILTLPFYDLLFCRRCRSRLVLSNGHDETDGDQLFVKCIQSGCPTRAPLQDMIEELADLLKAKFPQGLRYDERGILVPPPSSKTRKKA
jgi:hypothetical protein